jgi:hypothetical protein
MNSWQIWFSDGRVEQHSRREQLSVAEMEAILDGYLDLQTILNDGELCDMIVRWDAMERMLPVNERATDGWRAALMARGLKSLRSEVIRGDVIVLGYPLLRRTITPGKRLETLRMAAEQGTCTDVASLDRAAMELVLGELLEIDEDAQRAGYRAAVQNSIAQYRAILLQMSAPDDADSEKFEE